jgi:hypothetical protein
MSLSFRHRVFCFFLFSFFGKRSNNLIHIFSQTAELCWVVENSSLADEGNYSCYASNVAGRSSSGTWLTITGD